jgi:hypothetical protein
MMVLVLAIGMTALGLSLTVANWFIVYRVYVKKERGSWAPLLGGLCLAAGMATLPFDWLHNYAWLPLFLDYGCIPGLAQTAWFFITGQHK